MGGYSTKIVKIKKTSGYFFNYIEDYLLVWGSFICNIAGASFLPKSSSFCCAFSLPPLAFLFVGPLFNLNKNISWSSSLSLGLGHCPPPQSPHEIFIFCNITVFSNLQYSSTHHKPINHTVRIKEYKYIFCSLNIPVAFCSALLFQRLPFLYTLVRPNSVWTGSLVSFFVENLSFVS